jgi:hypothetical protein
LEPKKATNTSYTPKYSFVERTVISKRNYNAEIIRTIPRKSRRGSIPSSLLLSSRKMKESQLDNKFNKQRFILKFEAYSSHKSMIEGIPRPNSGRFKYQKLVKFSTRNHRLP